MFKTGFEIFLRLPNSGNDRLLHPAVVEAASEQETRLLLKEEGVEVSEDLDVILYFKRKHSFLQQPAHITAVELDDTTYIVTLTTSGDPISAEGREFYRVTAISADVDAKVGSGEPCRLQNVSASGFAIVSSDNFSIGEILPVVLRYKNTEYTGTVCIQTIRALGRNRTRYGLSCVSGAILGNSLLDGLTRLSLLIQRDQLSRR